MICSFCGRDQDDDAVFCSSCGEQLQGAPVITYERADRGARKPNRALPVVMSVLVLGVGFLLGALFGGMFDKKGEEPYLSGTVLPAGATAPAATSGEGGGNGGAGSGGIGAGTGGVGAGSGATAPSGAQANAAASSTNPPVLREGDIDYVLPPEEDDEDDADEAEEESETDEPFIAGDYTGRMYGEVFEELRDEGIIIYEIKVTDEELEEGAIVRQSVEEGHELKRNAAELIIFEVSAGRGPFVIPDYRELGTEGEAAEAELKENGFEVIFADGRNSVVQSGYVVRTEPGAGAQPPAGTEIIIYRSTGSEREKSVVPFLTGSTFFEAQALIEEAKLRIGYIAPNLVSTTAVVSEQSTDANMLIDEWTELDLSFIETEPLNEKSEYVYIVKSGDSLMKIAQRYYGNENAALYPLILERNEITNDRFMIGQALIIPPKPEPSFDVISSDEPDPDHDDGGPEDHQDAIGNVETNLTSISLVLPQDRTYGDTVKVLVGATPSDTGRLFRLVDRIVDKDEFPLYLEFHVPREGTVEIRVFYNDELIEARTFYDE